jgi:hypothetical protein
MDFDGGAFKAAMAIDRKIKFVQGSLISDAQKERLISALRAEQTELLEPRQAVLGQAAVVPKPK